MRLPTHVRAELKAATQKRANEFGYLDKNRIANSNFLDYLFKDAEIGGRLKEYMPDNKVARYIKDSLINQYAKQSQVLEHNVDEVLLPIYGQHLTEQYYSAANHLSVYHNMEDKTIVVGRGTLVKWETGLRKVLMYVAKTPSLPPSKSDCLDLVLVIFLHQKSIPPADRQLIEKALWIANVRGLWMP